jgi:UDP-2-acetamido-3-amino-2,3-dideoxy-glucuronate N-acetyltransferase
MNAKQDMKLVLVGCGGWGKNIARTLAALDALAVLVDPASEAQALAKELGVRHATDISAIVDDDSFPAIVIATPAETHFSLGRAMLEAGKDIFVEKPIALSSAEGRELGQIAAASGRILMVGHLLQYHPGYRKLHELAQTGMIGKVHHIISSRCNLGMLRNEENVMWSFAPHDVSMVLGLASDQSPVRIACHGSDFFQPGIHDVTTMRLEFENGLTAEIRSSWFHPEKEQKLCVVGSAALAVFDDTAPEGRKLRLKRYTIDHGGVRPRAIGQEEEFIAVASGQPLSLELGHFLECIEKRLLPRTDAEEANRVLVVLETAQRSLELGGVWIDV